MRTFEARPAVRERVPLWLGLFGPPGSGKTYSALRLATGIASETEGKIYVIDTEARRALHYADRFRFVHVDMGSPFSSGDYLAAAKHCVTQGASILIIDSFSHEHEGPGGYLDTHDTELERIAGNDRDKRERAKMLAWTKPSRERQAMVNAMGQLPCHVICAFRAKEKVKPLRDKSGRMVPTELGWQPISGTELLYSMTVNMLLRPHAGGVPSWDSEHEAERLMMKLPEQFRPLFEDKRPLDEKHGAHLAQWAAGSRAMKADKPAPADKPPFDQYDDERVETVLAEASCEGMDELARAWKVLPPYIQKRWKSALEDRFKPIAGKFDDAAKQEQTEKRKAQANGPT